MSRSEEPETFLKWDDYARADRFEVSPYLFESGASDAPVGELRVRTEEYTSRQFHEREVAGLWTKVWQMACRATELSNVGDYLEYEIVGYSILLVRVTTDSIRGYRNACRHRGTPIAVGSGNAQCFTCPFHGWNYGLDGALTDIPAEWDFVHIEKAKIGLQDVRVEIFDGWVFINLDDDAEGLQNFLGDTVVRHLLTWPDERKWKAVHVGVVVDANWKVVLDTFMESYHSSFVHPTIAACSGDVQSRYDMFGLHARYIQPLMVPSVLQGQTFNESEVLEAAVGPLGVDATLPDGETARRFWADQMRERVASGPIDLGRVSDTEIIDPVHYDLFPNFLVNRGPTNGGRRRIRPNGDDHTTSIFEFMMLKNVPPGEPRPPDVPLTMLRPGEVFDDYEAAPGAGVGFLHDQDMAICSLTQRGLRNIKELVFGARQERNIVAFHRNLARFIERHTAFDS